MLIVVGVVDLLSCGCSLSGSINIAIQSISPKGVTRVVCGGPGIGPIGETSVRELVEHAFVWIALKEEDASWHTSTNSQQNESDLRLPGSPGKLGVPNSEGGRRRDGARRAVCSRLHPRYSRSRALYADYKGARRSEPPVREGWSEGI